MASSGTVDRHGRYSSTSGQQDESLQGASSCSDLPASVTEYPPFPSYPAGASISPGQFAEFPDFSSIYANGQFTEGRQCSQQLQLLIVLAQAQGLLPGQLMFRLGKDLSGKFQAMPSDVDPQWWPQHVGRKLAGKDISPTMRKKGGFMSLWSWVVIGVCSAKGPGSTQLCGSLVTVGQKLGDTNVSIHLFGRCRHGYSSTNGTYTHDAIKQYHKQRQHEQQQQQHAVEPYPQGVKRKGEPDLDDQLAEMERQYQQKLQDVKRLEAEKQQLADKAWVMEQVLDVHETAKQSLRECQSGGHDECLRFLGTCDQELRTGTSNQLFLAKFKHVQQRIASALLDYESGRDGGELHKLCQAYKFAARYFVVAFPESMMFNSLHVDSVATDGSLTSCAESMPAASREHWHNVAVAAQLQPKALAKCHMLKQLVHNWHGRIQAERHVLSQALSECTSKSGLGRYVGVQEAGTSAAAQAPHTQQEVLPGLPDAPPEDSVAARMTTLMEKERNVVMILCEILYCRIYSDLELARVVAHSYPYVPDDLLIVDELSALHCQQQGVLLPEVDLEQLLLDLE